MQMAHALTKKRAPSPALMVKDTIKAQVSTASLDAGFRFANIERPQQDDLSGHPAVSQQNTSCHLRIGYPEGS